MDATAPGSAVPVLEVGGSHVTAAAVAPDARRVLEGTLYRLPLAPDAGPDAFLSTLAEAAREMLGSTATAATHLGGTWGVAVPGPFDYARGIARYRGVGKFAALDGLPVGDLLAGRLAPRAARLRFLNDARAFALGAWHTDRRAPRRLVALTLGTGVGSAFLDRGRPVGSGPLVPPEGRADLLAIAGRPLEETVSTRALTGRYLERTGRRVDGLRELAGRAGEGDALARDVVESALYALGAAIAPWLVAFEADALVVGGSMTAAWDLIGPPFRAGLAARTPRPPGPEPTVRQDGESAALLGAAVHALRDHG